MAQYLKHAPSGRIYPYSDALAGRNDMQYLDAVEANRALRGIEPEPQAPATQETAEPEAEEPRASDEMLHASVSRMNKDDLEAYALAAFGVDIDKRKTLTELRSEVAELKRTRGA